MENESTLEETIEKRVGQAQPTRLARVARFLDPVIFYALLVVIALTAIPYGTVEPWWVATFECAVFALGLLWVIEGLCSGAWLVAQHRLLAPLLAVVAFAILQMILPLRSFSGAGGTESTWRPISFSPYDTQLFIYELLALVVVAGLLLRYTTSRRRLMTLVSLVIGVGFVSTVFGIIRQAVQRGPGFLLPHLQDPRGVSSYAQFINHNHFAFLAEMSLGLLLGLMLGKNMRFKWRLLCVALAVPMALAIVYTGSRGGIVSMLGEVVFVALLVFVIPSGQALLREKRSRRAVGEFLVTRAVLIVSLVLVMIFGIIWAGGDPLGYRLESVPDEFGKESDKYSNTMRSKIWPTTWQLIKDHPVAGVGFGSYWIAITKYHKASGAFTPQQAHNEYLDLLAAAGLIGAAIGIWFLILFFKAVANRLRYSDAVLRASCFGALAGIFAVAVHSVLDFGLRITINNVIFMTLVVIATVTGDMGEQQKTGTGEEGQREIGGVALPVRELEVVRRRTTEITVRRVR